MFSTATFTTIKFSPFDCVALTLISEFCGSPPQKRKANPNVHMGVLTRVLRDSCLMDCATVVPSLNPWPSGKTRHTKTLQNTQKHTERYLFSSECEPRARLGSIHWCCYHRYQKKKKEPSVVRAVNCHKLQAFVSSVTFLFTLSLFKTAAALLRQSACVGHSVSLAHSSFVKSVCGLQRNSR